MAVSFLDYWIRSSQLTVLENYQASQGLSGEEPPANAEGAGDSGSIPGSGRAPEEEMATHSQYFSLEPWTEEPGGWATVHRVGRVRRDWRFRIHAKH